MSMNISVDDVRKMALDVIRDANITDWACKGESAMACVNWISGVLEMADRLIENAAEKTCSAEEWQEGKN